MAIKKHLIVGDCALLPFGSSRPRATPAGNTATIMTGVSDGSFCLRNLTGHPILEWPPELPKYDPRGHRNASEFEAWKKSQDSKFGMAGNSYSFKGWGEVPCLSTVEKRHLLCFDYNPYVVEIRMQYPEWDCDRFKKYKVANERFPKNGIMTIDFMLTLKIPGESCLRYHAVSSKRAEDLDNVAVAQRHKREKEFVRKWNCTHEVLADNEFSELEYENLGRLFQYMREVKFDAKFADLASDTKKFSLMLNNSTAKGSVDRVLGMSARRLGLDLDTGHRLFAIGVFLGYLKWDHRFPLLPEARWAVLQ